MAGTAYGCHIIVEAIRNDPEWKNGDYRQQPRGYTRIAPLVVIMTGNPVRQFEAYPTREAADAWYQPHDVCFPGGCQ